MLFKVMFRWLRTPQTMCCFVYFVLLCVEVSGLMTEELHPPCFDLALYSTLKLWPPQYVTVRIS